MRIVLSIWILSLPLAVLGYTDNKVRRFKDGFLFGAASAAYQVEGAWDEDGKGPSVWDQYFHTGAGKLNGAPGDVASDSYHNYKRDVEMLRELGVDFYRFSISWPRILPTGFSHVKNELGLQYYDNLIDELLKYNIQPVVTLYHFDLPVAIQDMGGWVNPHSVDWFEDYARVVFDRYASKVKYWITINQPNSNCEVGNWESPKPRSARGLVDYLCAKYILLAHARAYRLYEKEYKHYGGSVGISLSINWVDPLTNSTTDVEAADVYREFAYGLYLNPIWSKSGDFPKVVKDRVAKRSEDQGFSRSRLPTLTKNEIKLIKGSADFLGLNHYTTFFVSPTSQNYDVPSLEDDVGVDKSSSDKWRQSYSFWLKSAPYGLYKTCLYLNKKYDYPTIFVTENGWSTDRGLMDTDRSENIQQYLKALLLAIEDGTEVLGYTYWSLMDNVEWTAGTRDRFGLYEVDFESPSRTRIARQSALVYKRIIQKRIVEEGWTPDTLEISITKVNKKKLKGKTEL